MLPVSAFAKRRASQDGLQYVCKACDSENARVYYQSSGKAIRAKQHTYYIEHKDNIYAQHRAYQRTHQKETLEYNKAYRQTDVYKAIHRASEARRRARKGGALCENFAHEEIFERDSYICQYCGCKTQPNHSQTSALFPNLDHIIPLARGGEHTRANVQCLCKECNQAKGSRSTNGLLLLVG